MDVQKLNQAASLYKKKFHFDNLYFNDPQLYESFLLYQIGDLCCEGGYQIDPHVQRCYEISFIISGCGKYYTNGKSYDLKQGDIYICLPGEHHSGQADLIDPFRYLYVGFDFSIGEHGEQNHFLHIKRIFDHLKKPAAHSTFDIDKPFIDIFNELINSNEYSRSMIGTYLTQIIILAYRSFLDNWKKTYAPDINLKKSATVVYDVINFIDLNLFSISCVTDIAKELGYSYSYLSHVFTKETGITIKEYYTKKRFESATELLKNSCLSITQVSEKLKFDTIYSFSRAFHTYYGISPTQYQIINKDKKG